MRNKIAILGAVHGMIDMLKTLDIEVIDNVEQHVRIINPYDLDEPASWNLEKEVPPWKERRKSPWKQKKNNVKRRRK